MATCAFIFYRLGKYNLADFRIQEDSESRFFCTRIDKNLDFFRTKSYEIVETWSYFIRQVRLKLRLRTSYHS